MNNDWKDALASLRSNLNEPVNEEPVTLNEENSTEKTRLQKNPLTIVTDKKGRNGKIATIVEGFTIPQQDVEDIARKLKQKLGVGGSVRDGEILIQGDYKDKVKQFLSLYNFKTK